MSLKYTDRWIEMWTALRDKYPGEPDHVAKCEDMLAALREIKGRELGGSS